MNTLNKNIYISDENTRKNFNFTIQMINNAESKVFINYTYINNIISTLEKNTNYEEFTRYFKKCIEYLKSINLMFPQFILLDDIELKTKYTRKYLEDTTQPKKMLIYLLETLGMSLDNIKNYWKLNKEDDKYNFEQEMNDKIETIMQGFNKFYKQEKVIF